MVIETFSPEETEELGIHFGKEAKPGTVCTLIGDLGIGKTYLRRNCKRSRNYRADQQPDVYDRTGLCRGHDPSFTISMSTG